MTKLTFLFWNVARKDLRRQIENLVHLYDVDVLMLAENRLSDEEVLSARLAGRLSAVPEQNGKVQIFSKFQPDQILTVANEPRYTVRMLTQVAYVVPNFSNFGTITKSRKTNEFSDI